MAYGTEVCSIRNRSGWPKEEKFVSYDKKKHSAPGSFACPQRSSVSTSEGSWTRDWLYMYTGSLAAADDVGALVEAMRMMLIF